MCVCVCVCIYIYIYIYIYICIYIYIYIYRKDIIQVKLIDLFLCDGNIGDDCVKFAGLHFINSSINSSIINSLCLMVNLIKFYSDRSCYALEVGSYHKFSYSHKIRGGNITNLLVSKQIAFHVKV